MSIDRKHGPRDSRELVESAKALFDAMAYPFDMTGEFNPLYYTAEFDFIPQRDGAVHLPAGVRSTIEHGLELDIDCGQDPWRIEVNYDPFLEELSPNKLSFSALLADGTKKRLALQRYAPHGYFPLVADSDYSEPKIYQREDQLLEERVFDKADITTIAPSLVTTLLDEAGFRITKNQRPESWLAPTLDDSKDWKRTERVVSPVSPDGDQVYLERVHLYINRGDTEVDNGGHLLFCSEEVTTEGTRRQVRIKFSLHNFDVEVPTVTIRTLSATNTPSPVNNQGPGSYSVTEEEDMPVTPALLDAVHEDLLDLLGDVA